ncbi:MAG: sugar transferase [Elusimicrobiota bacterium]
MDAIILVGGVSRWLYPLACDRPRAMLGVGNVPALRRLFDHLAKNGVDRFLIPLSPDTLCVRNYFGDGRRLGHRIVYRYEEKYKGTAGCWLAFQDVLGDQPFFVINGNGFSRFDLKPFMDSPPAESPFLIVGVRRPDAGEAAPSADTPVKTAFWQSLSAPPADVYYVHPQILARIPAGKHFDLKEQLIPAAIAGGCGVWGLPLEGRYNGLKSFQDYLDANREVLNEGDRRGSGARRARVAGSASFHGAVLIGEDAVIGPDSVVVGPTVIGPGCRIGRGALVYQSVLNTGARVGNLSQVRRSILAEGAYVRPGIHLRRSLAFNGTVFPKGHARLLEGVPWARRWRIRADRFSAKSARVRSACFFAFKRAADIAGALLLAPAAAACCAAAAVLIKATSGGPVFYSEKRIGRGGREFSLYKLRTMVPGAHLKQEVLKELNQSDGPMFKIVNDPRITPLGRWLRRTSLDELPQLLNVLRGEMSLVGPRPLAAREMAWQPGWREMRLRVRPGMTGLWQVRCGSCSDFADWIACDVEYVRNVSFRLDIGILLATAAVVLRGRRGA